MRTLALRTGALGDLVLTLPVLDRLADAGPLTVVAPERYAALFHRADAWIDADGPAGAALFRGIAPPGHDRAVAWTASAASALRSCGIADVLEGRPRPDPGVHAADHLWAPLVPLYGPRDRDPQIPRPSPDPATAGAVILSPGSGGARKRWPLDRWRAVADAVVARGGRCVWVGGPLEDGEDGWGAPRITPDLPGLVAVAASARAWLGPDSGPLHVAAAVGCRAGAVFVDTDPSCWCPLGGVAFAADASPDALAAWALGG